MHHAAGVRVGDPAGVPATGGDASVEGLRHLQVDEGTAVVHGGEERQIESQRFLGLHADGHHDAGRAQQAYPGAADVRVGVEGGHRYPGDPGADDPSGAGRGELARVGCGTRLQVAVEVRSARALAARVEGGGLGVAGAVTLVEPLADHPAGLRYHASGEWIGRGAAATACGQLQRALHVVAMVRPRHVHAPRTSAPAVRTVRATAAWAGRAQGCQHGPSPLGGSKGAPRLRAFRRSCELLPSGLSPSAPESHRFSPVHPRRTGVVGCARPEAPITTGLELHHAPKFSQQSVGPLAT